MYITFKCPQCGKAVEADESAHGQVAECPYCGKNIVVSSVERNSPLVPNPPPRHGRRFLIGFKWVWPCLVLIGFIFKMHNMRHRAKESRPASPSAICPFCWLANPRTQKSGKLSDLSNSVHTLRQRKSDMQKHADMPRHKLGDETKDDEPNVETIVQKRIREIAATQRQEEITEEKKRRNREMGRPETAGFTVADYTAYSGGRRGGWAWRDKKEKGTRSFANDLDYAFETSTGFSSDTRTDQEKKEDAILRQALTVVKDRYRQRLHHIGSTESDYSLSESSCTLVLYSTKNGILHISYDIKSSELSDWPHVIPKATARQLIQDRLNIDILENVIDP